MPMDPVVLLGKLNLTPEEFSDYLTKYNNFLGLLNAHQLAFYKRKNHGNRAALAAAITTPAAPVTPDDLASLLSTTPSAGMMIAVSCCDGG